MTETELTDRIIAQGRVLVCAIESLGVIEPTGPFERAIARLLADLSEADLRNAHVTDEQLSVAESLEGAIMPDGTVHE